MLSSWGFVSCDMFQVRSAKWTRTGQAMNTARSSLALKYKKNLQGYDEYIIASISLYLDILK